MSRSLQEGTPEPEDDVELLDEVDERPELEVELLDEAKPDDELDELAKPLDPPHEIEPEAELLQPP
ncbi:MAG TPA: hypothetical protein PK129_16000, partial [Cellvibrionaceae bacterium]|nr:hypothetical protein [Cellvibrionaceae bacterium]